MADIPELNPADYSSIVFFTGAGMSAESGIPTYRGAGGIWHEYHWEEYACQQAFDTDPDKVLDFHELRRAKVRECRPHRGHDIITRIQKQHPDCWIVTQNIDGMHQHAGSGNVVELHGSLWRLRCEQHGVVEDHGDKYKIRRCPDCSNPLRPDITWFNDMLDSMVLQKTHELVMRAELFIAVGTSGVVYPAALFPRLAREAGARCVFINTEATADASIYDIVVQGKASEVLTKIFPE